MQVGEKHQPAFLLSLSFRAIYKFYCFISIAFTQVDISMHSSLRRGGSSDAGGGKASTSFFTFTFVSCDL